MVVTLTDLLKESKDLGKLNGLVGAIEQSGRFTSPLQDQYLAGGGNLTEEQRLAFAGFKTDQKEQMVYDEVRERTGAVQNAVSEFGYQNLVNQTEDPKKLLGVAFMLFKGETGSEDFDKIAKKIKQFRELNQALANGDYTAYANVTQNKRIKQAVLKYGEANPEEMKVLISRHLRRAEKEIKADFSSGENLDLGKLRGYILSNYTKLNDDEKRMINVDTALRVA